MIDPEITGDPHSEIKEKVDFWHSRMESQLTRFNSMANFWRILKPSRNADFSGFANPQVTETTRAVEAIATFFYRAMTSAQPNFQFLSNNPNVTPEQLWCSERTVEWQLTATNYRRKLLKACRSLGLFGTVAIEQPWTTNMPYYESTDFIPRSLIQMAFDPLSFDISLSPWHASIDYITEEQLRALGKNNPDVWDQQAIEDAISASSEAKNLSPELTARMAAAGYNSFAGNGSNFTSRIFQLIIYYGPLKNDVTRSEWCVATINDLKTIKAHRSDYRRRPFAFAHMNEFEMEPYAYGVGRLAESMQPEINSNRGRMHDVITFALFNQWLADRNANIKPSQMRIKPWGVIEVDGNVETALKAVRPQIEAVNFGLQMENMLKTEFRSTSGASDSLQAIVTQATATESSLAQNESVRRLSVMAEVASEVLLREHISKMHENNLTFLDQPFSIAVTGQQQSLRIFPSSLAIDVQVQTKIVTDKDFRPQRNKDLLQFMQIASSMAQQNPQMGKVNMEPFVSEFARAVGMNPKNVWQAIPPMPGLIAPPQNAPQGAPMPNAMQRMAQLQQQSESMRGKAGELGAESHNMAMAGVQ